MSCELPSIRVFDGAFALIHLRHVERSTTGGREDGWVGGIVIHRSFRREKEIDGDRVFAERGPPSAASAKRPPPGGPTRRSHASASDQRSAPERRPHAGREVRRSGAASGCKTRGAEHVGSALERAPRAQRRKQLRPWRRGRRRVSWRRAVGSWDRRRRCGCCSPSSPTSTARSSVAGSCMAQLQPPRPLLRRDSCVT